MAGTNLAAETTMTAIVQTPITMARAHPIKVALKADPIVVVQVGITLHQTTTREETTAAIVHREVMATETKVVVLIKLRTLVPHIITTKDREAGTITEVAVTATDANLIKARAMEVIETTVHPEQLMIDQSAETWV